MSGLEIFSIPYHCSEDNQAYHSQGYENRHRRWKRIRHPAYMVLRNYRGGRAAEQVARCAKKISYLLYELDKLKGEGTLFKISDDKLIEVCGLLDKIKEVVNDV